MLAMLGLKRKGGREDDEEEEEEGAEEVMVFVVGVEEWEEPKGSMGNMVCKSASVCPA